METQRISDISPNLIRFAGVAEYVNYCIWQHKIAYENGMDEPAERDISSGYNYIQTFLEDLSPEDRNKYSPLCDILLNHFLEKTKSHKRLPGLTSSPFNH